MNMFVVVRSDKWLVHGPLQYVGHIGADKIMMSNEQKYPVNDCFKTKGGATKSCYRRNYDEKGTKK